MTATFLVELEVQSVEPSTLLDLAADLSDLISDEHLVHSVKPWARQDGAPISAPGSVAPPIGQVPGLF